MTGHTNAEQFLILAVVVKDGAADITSITDCREFHRNSLGLIQSASYSVDMSRELIFELGNKRAVARSLNKPVNVTVDFSAMDSDEELYTLRLEMHGHDHEDTRFSSPAPRCAMGAAKLLGLGMRKPYRPCVTSQSG